MPATLATPRAVSIRPTPASLQVMAVLLAAAAMLPGQSASLATNSVPAYGQAFFDAAGDQYYMQGPVTPGSAQTQPGGGTCNAARLIFSFPGPCSDAQIVKLDPSGNLIYGTYLGGPSADAGAALAIDPSGNVFLTGSTGGQFPTTPGSAIPSSTTAQSFAARLSADGSTFAYVTYLPSTVASAKAIALDAQDNAYITGANNTGAAGVIKLSPDGSTILYNITLAPSSIGLAIAIDPSGNVIVAGATGSPNFPITTGAIQSTLTGTQNLFLARLDPSGNILYATYLGGGGIDTPTQLQLDSSGNIYIAGSTTSTDFPATPGTFEPTAVVPLWNNTGPGGFAAKFSADLTTLLWSTYVQSTDQGQAGVSQMTVAPSGDVYLAGITGGTFPITASAPVPCFGNSSALFVAHLNSAGALADSTYLNSPPEYNPPNGIYGLGMPTGNSVEAIWQYSGTNLSSTIQFGGPGYTAPACLSTTVLNAATQYGASPFSSIAPGEILTLTGFGMGPSTGVAAPANAKGAYPTQLSGVQVLIDGNPAPVLYAQSEQINVIAPASFTSSAFANIQVVYQNQQLPVVPVSILPTNPGVFRAQPGVSTQAYTTNQDGTLNGPDNPAPPGSVVSILATGLGPTTPACTPGGPNVPSLTGLAPGVTPEISNGSIVTYAGSEPGYACGIERVSFQLPSNTPAGGLKLQLWANQTQSNALQNPIFFTIAVGN